MHFFISLWIYIKKKKNQHFFLLILLLPGHLVLLTFLLSARVHALWMCYNELSFNLHLGAKKKKSQSTIEFQQNKYVINSTKLWPACTKVLTGWDATRGPSIMLAKDMSQYSTLSVIFLFPVEMFSVWEEGMLFLECCDVMPGSIVSFS